MQDDQKQVDELIEKHGITAACARERLAQSKKQKQPKQEKPNVEAERSQGN